MTNYPTLFKSIEFGDLRVITAENGDPLFCATDITTILGYKNGRKAISDNCNPKGVTQSDTPTSGGVQQMTYITESNLYRLILRSRIPDAEKVQNWVCEEILPSIRRDGGYIATKPDDSPEIILARAVLVANKAIDSLNAKNRLLEACNQDNVRKLQAQEPKVLFADSVATSSKSILIGELAKIITQNGYTIGQNRLFNWLRTNGYLGTSGERYNIPHQKYIEQGLFELKETAINQPGGTVIVSITTKVTGKGQIYFINKFLNQ